MIIKNVKVFKEDYKFHPGELYIRDNCFVDYPEDNEAEVIDGKGAYAIPGLTDIHFHGCAGYNYSDGTMEAITGIAKYEALHGITQICPASLTMPEEELAKVYKATADYERKEGAYLVGINMEGPYLSKAKKGAQNEAYLHRPDTLMFRRLNEISGNMIKLVAVAPEEDGALEFIEEVKKDTIVSIAHTTADYETAMKAFEIGASHVTHLYNAMLPFTHRAPGVIGAAADFEGCRVELIADGVHIDPAAVRATFKLFSDERIIIVSDSMEATGLGDGEYTLGGLVVKVTGVYARLEDGTIASSVSNLMDCVRTVVKMGIPLESAVKCAAVNPAKQIGIFDRFGSLEAGKIANLVLLDQDLSTKAVFMDGKCLEEYRSNI